MKRFFISLLAASLTLAACKDDTVPSTVDTKPSLEGQWNDLSYAPGDNFYMYCNGTFWKEQMPQENIAMGLFTDLGTYVWDRFVQSGAAYTTDEWFGAIDAIRQSSDDDAFVKDAATQMAQRIALIEQATTKQELAQTLATILEQGGRTILNPKNELAVDTDGTTFTPWTIGVDTSLVSVLRQTSLEELLAQIGLDEEDAMYYAAVTSSFIQQINQNSSASQAPKRTRQRSVAERLKQAPLAEEADSDANDFVSLMAQALGHSETYRSFVVLEDDEDRAKAEAEKKALDQINQADLDMLQSISICALAADHMSLSSQAAACYNGPIQSFGIVIDNEQTRLQVVKNTLLMMEPNASTLCQYAGSYEIIKHTVSPETRQAYNELCEELRAALVRRINALDWMSETTKGYALEKVQAMRFFQADPLVWVDEAMPDISVSPQELRKELRTKYLNLVFGIPQLDRQEGIVNYVYAYEENATNVNAFYVYNYNIVVILPAFMDPAVFSADNSDALNYAAATVLGHEISHGFDSNGSKYDKDGVKADWWTINDGMEYDDRCQLLAATHGAMRIYPEADADLKGDAQKTLAEDIADLAGLLISLDAYTAKLQAQGFYGEELDKQQRRFFENYAELWRAAYTYDYAKLSKEQDVHSLTRDRVNGVVMNTDRWYELYNVTKNNKLYLAPARRAYIW